MLRLTVLAHPGARQERIEVVDHTTLAVWVLARPTDGQANIAIERLIADNLGLRPRQVSLVAGSLSRRKILAVDLPDRAALRQRLLAHGLRLT